MVDTIERFHGSLIQHGHHSDRVYLMKLEPPAPPALPTELEQFATRHRYSKLFVKVPMSESPLFESAGYVEEASIPCFYHGKNEVAFLCKYLRQERAHDERASRVEEVLEMATDKPTIPPKNIAIPTSYTIRTCTEADVDEMSEIYQVVFPTYPFPIHEPEYLRETMGSHIDYFCACREGRMVALASSEMDKEARNVEMTDFATLPEALGHGLALCLLKCMEEAMIHREMRTAYTIARALSPGMNITFAKMGYTFAGTLINNTNISGGIESMNVWYKALPQVDRGEG